MSYQSHEPGSAESVSDSHRKLQRIHLPDDLSGKRLLDIGCNEGFFCGAAAERGATVVGIDTDRRALHFARGRYSHHRTTFIEQTWASLPEGPFDIVLWLSAIHYEQDPKTVLRQISDRLAPNGVLILECGIHPANADQPIPVVRPAGDTPFYQTETSIARLLDGFAYRQVEPGEQTPGDPIPRRVFHCRKRLPTVLLVSGRSESGKSHLARRLGGEVVSLDRLVPSLMYGETHVTPLQKYAKTYRERAEVEGLEAFLDGIDAAGLTEEYTRLIARCVQPSHDILIIEGYMTEAQTKSLGELLRDRAIVWHTTRYP